MSVADERVETVVERGVTIERRYRPDGSLASESILEMGPRPCRFRAALLAQLDGATRAAKLARAQTLRERSPGLTEPFLTALAGSALSADEADLIVAIWARIRALAGTPGEVLTAAEISRIEALAPTYLVRLL